MGFQLPKKPPDKMWRFHDIAVKVFDNDIEAAIRDLKKKTQEERLYQDYNRRRLVMNSRHRRKIKDQMVRNHLRIRKSFFLIWLTKSYGWYNRMSSMYIVPEPPGAAIPDLLPKPMAILSIFVRLIP